MYFKEIPIISQEFTIGNSDQNILIRDITTNVRFLKKSLESIQLFDNYIIKDGDTPEIISDKFYGNPEYHWIVMLANEKYNYMDDFPKNQTELEDYLEEQYGEAIDHPAVYIKNGFVVDSTTPGATYLTNREYETLINDQKRPIKIIPKQYINNLINEYRSILNG